MPLSDAQCRKAKAADKPIKLADDRGLYLYVAPSGLRSWRLKYRHAGKEKKLTFGAYPEVSLAEARERRDEARRIIRDGRDPGAERRARAEAEAPNPAHLFEAVARDWHARNRRLWSPRHAGDVLHSLERDAFPTLGHLPVRIITTPKVLEAVQAVEARPAIETARRARQRISAVFAYAIAQGLCDHDPAHVVKGALQPLRKGRQPAIVDLDEARVMLAKAEGEAAHPLTRLALRLLALTAVRPGELRGMRWDEIEGVDWATGAAVEPLWRIPAARMKGKLDRKEEVGGDHLVPLAPAAVDVLLTVRQLSGRGPLPFPNARRSHVPMSENALGYLLNRAGYHQRHVPHGFRALFSTVMNGRYRADGHVIELMLAHVPKDKVRAAYDRAAHMERRRELAEIWAGLILEGRPDAEVMLDGPRR